jgi:hypothetical protein
MPPKKRNVKGGGYWEDKLTEKYRYFVEQLDPEVEEYKQTSTVLHDVYKNAIIELIKNKINTKLTYEHIRMQIRVLNADLARYFEMMKDKTFNRLPKAERELVNQDIDELNYYKKLSEQYETKRLVYFKMLNRLKSIINGEHLGRYNNLKIIPKGAIDSTEGALGDEIKSGDLMVDFSGEYNNGRYYKEDKYLRLIAKPKLQALAIPHYINPMTDEMWINPTPYRAHVEGDPVPTPFLDFSLTADPKATLFKAGRPLTERSARFLLDRLVSGRR